MADENRLECLKRELNALYGRSFYEPKTLTFIDNRRKMEDFKMSNTARQSIDEAITYNIQQSVYRSLIDTPSMTFKIDTSEKSDIPNEAEEKWTWVTGYKGLDKDMKAYSDFQYEMDKLYIMPDGKPVKVCEGGFHTCLNLKDLYEYKSVGSGNRFFECKALVREKDLEQYGKVNFIFRIDKLAAKSIRLIRELSVDEILAHIEEVNEWPQCIKEMAINESIDAAQKELKLVTMTKMGYARPLAEYILNDRNSEDGYKLAMALDAQTDISMDAKIISIFSHI